MVRVRKHVADSEQWSDAEWEGAPKPPGPLRRGLRRSAAAIAGTALFGATVMGLRLPAQDLLREPTPQEAGLEQIMRDNLGVNRTIRCLPASEVRRRPFSVPMGPSKPLGRAIPGHPLIWMEQSQCDALTAFAANPPQHPHSISGEGIAALTTLAHEESHARGTVNESGAECQGLQYTPAFAIAFGAHPDLQAHLAYIAAQKLADIANEQPAHYQLNPTCYPGSPYDLGLLKPFPWPPQAPPVTLPSDGMGDG